MLVGTTMRIVYDYAGQHTVSPAAPRASAVDGSSRIGNTRENVLVVRVGRGLDGEDRLGSRGAVDSGALNGIAPGDERWKISDEALERDRGVRAHENAHLSALGPYAASVISYDTVTGPGGETIAVGGRIAVDLSAVPGDPEATLRKAQTIIMAANAPGDPSAADKRVAARAYRLMQEARAELAVDEYA